MKRKKPFAAFVALLALCGTLLLPLAGCTGSASSPLVVDVNDRGATINQEMYGVFLEDISYAIDGGLVNNLLANGSFEYPLDPTYGWTLEGMGRVSDRDALNENNPHYLHMTPLVGTVTALNGLGFVEYYDDLSEDVNEERKNTPDIGVQEGHDYELSLFLRNDGFVGSVIAQLGQQSPVVLPLPQTGMGWEKISVTLHATQTADVGLRILFLPDPGATPQLPGVGSELLPDQDPQPESDPAGTVDVDMLCLSDKSAYGYDDPNWKYVSLRSDLYQAIADLNPGFIRFPGGCFLEGRDYEEMYDWKATIGPLEERLQAPNYWRDEEVGRDYQNTNAMGFHEYFQLCEDLGAKPFPILHAGFSCQGKAHYHTMEKKYARGKLSEAEWQQYLDSFALKPGTPEFAAYVQDVLDLIEYATGDVNTIWGAKRAENGHPEPFDLQYLGIGNENWGELYWRNFAPLYDAVKAAYPQLTIISSAGSAFSGERKETAWEKINTDYRDTLVDEHYYTENYKLFTHNDYYDDYDRTGAKVFLGEFSAMCPLFGKVITKNNLWSTIEEAAFMTGLERNGDVVQYVSYAPTYAKNNAHCWTNNLIWFDSQSITLTPTYYNFLLNANNIGTTVLNTRFKRSGCYSVTEVDEAAQVVYVKLVNAGASGFDFHVELQGISANSADLLYLSEKSRAAANRIGSTSVVPRQRDAQVDGGNVWVHVEGLSVNILRIPYGENDGSGLWRLPEMPANMQHTVTPYTKPYVTMEALVLMCIFLGGPLLAAAGFGVFVLIRKRKKNKTAPPANEP